MTAASLDGLRVVVTRSREASEKMARRLAAHGAEPVVLPCIEIAPLRSEALETALTALERFDWVVFTSANAVSVVCDLMVELEVDPARLARHAKVASVGEKTSAALRARGVEVALQPAEANAGSLVNDLCRLGVEGALVLFPASRIARETLADGLRQAGAGVVQVAAYDTVAPDVAPADALRAVRIGAVDVVTFTSPSTVENFVRLTGARHLPAVCIGATTAGAARAAGFDVAGVASEQTVEGLIEALAAFRERSLARE